ncbi:MAG: hypothetical protein ACI835_002742, partial [Planctomycetota bacterium]
AWRQEWGRRSVHPMSSNGQTIEAFRHHQAQAA